MIISSLPGTNIIYTTEHDSMTPAEIWDAWHSGNMAVFHILEYETRHGLYFDPDGTPHKL